LTSPDFALRRALTRIKAVAKRSKSEKDVLDLLQRYEAVCAILGRLSTPKVDEFLAVTAQSLTQVRDVLRMSPRPTSMGQIRTGLLQGLRELPIVLQSFLADISPSDRDRVFASIGDSVSGLPGFLKEQADKVRKVTGAGAVRNDDEWYLLRWRLDQIEGDDAHRQEIEALWKLLDAYEARSARPIVDD